MIDSIEDNLSFHPEELTLGQVGDDLFLDIRHRIMTAHFGPGSWLSVPGLAASRLMDDALALAVCRALQRHGYVTEVGAGKYAVKGWAAVDFQDTLKKMRDSQRSIAQKYSQHISQEDSRRLMCCRLTRSPQSISLSETEARNEFQATLAKRTKGAGWATGR